MIPINYAVPMSPMIKVVNTNDNDVKYINAGGHVDVYENGEPIFSEDNQTQARREYQRGYCEYLGRYCGNEDCDGCSHIPPYLVNSSYE